MRTFDSLWMRVKEKDVLKIFLGGTADECAVVDGADQRATVGVPRVVARRPRQFGRERGNKIIDSPADDCVIVHAHVEVDDANCVSHSYESRKSYVRHFHSSCFTSHYH